MLKSILLQNMVRFVSRKLKQPSTSAGGAVIATLAAFEDKLHILELFAQNPIAMVFALLAIVLNERSHKENE